MAEQRFCKAKVRGSSPRDGYFKNPVLSGFLLFLGIGNLNMAKVIEKFYCKSSFDSPASFRTENKVPCSAFRGYLKNIFLFIF